MDIQIVQYQMFKRLSFSIGLVWLLCHKASDHVGDNLYQFCILFFDLFETPFLYFLICSVFMCLVFRYLPKITIRKGDGM